MSFFKTIILALIILCLAGWICLADTVRALVGKAPADDDDSSPITPAPWTGRASFYSESYRGKKMANGAPFDPDALTCAAWDWPLGTTLLVSHGRRTVRVVVTDRGPAAKFPDRIVDLSRAAFAHIADTRLGVITVAVTVKSQKP
jgi:hypothetical protein